MAWIGLALNSTSDPDKVLFWAIICTAFFGFFRLGELPPSSPSEYNWHTHLSWGDVAVDNRDSPSVVKIHLRKSKCDQFGKGIDIFVGRTDSTILCPVTAITDYT